MFRIKKLNISGKIQGKIQVKLFQNLCFLPQIAIFGFKISSKVKSDPAILTGSKKPSWSQNLRSLAQKTKIW
jgi:hypothetical protein